MRKLLVWLLTFILIFMSTSMIGCGKKGPEKPPEKSAVLIPPDKATNYAGDWELPVVMNGGDFGIGEKVKLSDLLAREDVKLVLVDFWATWCEPCKEEMPYLQEIYAANKDKGLVPLVITIDANAGLEPAIKKAVEKMKWRKAGPGHKAGDPITITYPIPWDLKSDVKNAYGIGAIPVTFLVDKKGIIRYQHSSFTEELIDDLKAAVDKLLAEP